MAKSMAWDWVIFWQKLFCVYISVMQRTWHQPNNVCQTNMKILDTAIEQRSDISTIDRRSCQHCFSLVSNDSKHPPIIWCWQWILLLFVFVPICISVIVVKIVDKYMRFSTCNHIFRSKRTQIFSWLQSAISMLDTILSYHCKSLKSPQLYVNLKIGKTFNSFV